MEIEPEVKSEEEKFICRKQNQIEISCFHLHFDWSRERMWSKSWMTIEKGFDFMFDTVYWLIAWYLSFVARFHWESRIRIRSDYKILFILFRRSHVDSAIGIFFISSAKPVTPNRWSLVEPKTQGKKTENQKKRKRNHLAMVMIIGLLLLPQANIFASKYKRKIVFHFCIHVYLFELWIYLHRFVNSAEMMRRKKNQEEIKKSNLQSNWNKSNNNQRRNQERIRNLENSIEWWTKWQMANVLVHHQAANVPHRNRKTKQIAILHSFRSLLFLCILQLPQEIKYKRRVHKFIYAILCSIVLLYSVWPA